MATIADLKRKLQGLAREVENLSGKTISISPDENGMIDRQCPKEHCQAFFKVNAEDWKSSVKDEQAFCPFCRHTAKAQDFFPAEQKRAIVDSIKISIGNYWKYNRSIAENIISLKSSEEFALYVQCENCNVRFSVVGAAYFCPSCGFNSIERNATNSIAKLILKAEKIDQIKDAIVQSFTKDEAAIITKSIVENSLSDCIATLQTFSEEKYKQFSGVNPPFNAFQNVERSTKLWKELKGEGYEEWLTEAERMQLLLFTQRRHLLEHKGGLIDNKYLEITKDSSFDVGNRVIVNPSDIVTLGKIILKMISRINGL